MSEHGLEKLMTVDEAIALIDSIPIPHDQIRRLVSTSPNRRPFSLTGDVRSDRDYPPFDKAVMDGYAVRFADLPSVPMDLPLAGEVAAGDGGPVTVAPGTCVAIMTGAPIPVGADTVVQIEDTQLVEGRVRFLKQPKRGAAIAKQGSDLRAGELVLSDNAIIGPAQVGALAQVGSIGRRVSDLFSSDSPLSSYLLVTGNEIVDSHFAGQAPDQKQIRDANGPMIRALLASLHVSGTWGYEVDDFDRIRDTIDRVSGNDLVFVTGGMSMGKYDFVPRALLELGFELRITKLRIKPGKPFVFATRERKDKTDFVFGLPGNPVSAFCCTLRLASRLIARLQGRAPSRDLSAAITEGALPANGPREFYQPAVIEGSRVTPLLWKGSADVFTLAMSNGLIIRPIDDPPRSVGDVVTVIRFDSSVDE